MNEPVVARRTVSDIQEPVSVDSNEDSNNALSGIELITRNASNRTSSEGSFEDYRNETSLAPADTRFAAWSFLLAALVEAVVWSFPYAFSIFLTAYLEDPAYASQPRASTLLPLVGTLSTGVIYLTGVHAYGLVGSCWSSLLGASYATKVEQLAALQGVMYALGGSLLYAPCISYISDWFVKRRGLANGIVMMGTAAGGLILPYVLPPLLRAHGTAKTLRIISLAVLFLFLPVLPFIKPRLPESRVHGPGRRSDRCEWLKDWSWWALIVTNTIHGFGAFVPILWLPTFASALNLSTSSTSLTIALLNGASAIGPLILGILTDHFSPWPLALTTCILSSLATFILWGVTGNVKAGLMVFGAAYGMLSGGWTTLWAGFIRDLSKDDPSLITFLYGFLMLTRGLGNVISSPISTNLSSLVSSSSGSTGQGGGTGFGVADGRFEKLIIYIGTCFAGAAFVAMIGWGGDKAARARRA